MIIANPLYDVVFKYLDEIRDKMDVEDEIDRIFEREINKYNLIIADKNKELEIERQKAEEERQKVEVERQKNVELLRQIAELQERVKNNRQDK